MKQKTALITGANSGIGKQAAIQLAQKGFHVLIGSRSRERGEKAVLDIKEQSKSDSVEMVELDLSSKQSIIDASAMVSKKLTCLDVLIHNAADFDISRKKPKQSVDGIETIWATNHIGPILLTDSLLDLMKSSDQGRIITIASQGLVMHPRLIVDIVDPEFKNRKFSVPKAYYQSKLAQVMYTYWLANELKETKITVNCIRVTNVKIDTSKYPDISGFMKFLYSIKSKFSISPAEMAITYTYLATDKSLVNTTGKYFNEKNQMVNSSKYSQDKDHIEAVMNFSYQYLK
ncbi:MAG: SDR family NAD(P)-dependent oxidoreductase [Crocinitomicaceae bacterium]